MSFSITIKINIDFHLYIRIYRSLGKCPYILYILHTHLSIPCIRCILLYSYFYNQDIHLCNSFHNSDSSRFDSLSYKCMCMM